MWTWLIGLAVMAVLTVLTRGVFLAVVALAGALYCLYRYQRSKNRQKVWAAQRQREEQEEAQRRWEVAEEQRRRQEWDVERAEHLGTLLMVSPAEFEQIVANLMRSAGYTDVQVVGGSRDLAADITGRDTQGRFVVVQCKQYNPSRKVGSKEMQQFIGMARLHHGAERCIYVTTASFTADASALANEHGIELTDGDGLTRSARRSAQAVVSPPVVPRPGVPRVTTSWEAAQVPVVPPPPGKWLYINPPAAPGRGDVASQASPPTIPPSGRHFRQG